MAKTIVVEVKRVDEEKGRMLVATYAGAEYMVEVQRWRLEDKHFEVGHLVDIIPREGDQFAHLVEYR